MATDWSARTASIHYFEKLVKQLKRTNDDDKELYEAALHALRRSQDHTAIQNRLQAIKGALERSPCPRPIADDDGTVLCCVRGGHCGCENAMALRGDSSITGTP